MKDTREIIMDFNGIGCVYTVAGGNPKAGTEAKAKTGQAAVSVRNSSQKRTGGAVMKKKAIVAGHICLDITPVFPERPVEKVNDLLQPGKLIHMNEADWYGILERVLPYVDFFVPSVEELMFMLDRERFEDLQKRAAGRDITDILNIEKDVRPLADTSIAAFLTAVLQGETPETSMHLAAAAGACCVSSYDALGGLKSFDEMKDKIAHNWAKND
ncbi:MAG: hypothetical protein LUI39_07700 [Lachnospiraceae bacterium]|nr:hypothetical protein [Lachnospiraceae bacterium]